MPKRLEELEELHSACDPCCVTSTCRKRRCKIVLDVDQVVCVDCDDCKVFIGKNTRPDFIILCCDSVRHVGQWFVIEMKGRISHPRHIVEQLQCGVDVITEDRRFRISDSSKRAKRSCG